MVDTRAVFLNCRRHFKSGSVGLPLGGWTEADCGPGEAVKFLPAEGTWGPGRPDGQVDQKARPGLGPVTPLSPSSLDSVCGHNEKRKFEDFLPQSALHENSCTLEQAREECTWRSLGLWVL